MRAYLKKDPTREGFIEEVYTTDFGQKRIKLVLDDEECGTLSIIDADSQDFELLEET